MAQLTSQDDFIKTALRLPKDVHARIQEAASAAGRSMNAEIIARLEASFRAAPTVPGVEGFLPPLPDFSAMDVLQQTNAVVDALLAQRQMIERLEAVGRWAESIRKDMASNLLPLPEFAPPDDDLLSPEDRAQAVGTKQPNRGR